MTTPGPRRVLIESPYAGDVARNERYARACLADSLARGEAPFASHLLYTQPGVLDDTNPEERAQGIEAGLRWGAAAQLTAVYDDLGITEGMRQGIARAKAEGRPVVVRQLAGWDDPEPPVPLGVRSLRHLSTRAPSSPDTATAAPRWRHDTHRTTPARHETAPLQPGRRALDRRPTPRSTTPNGGRMNTTQPRVRITPAHGGGWLIRCGACPATDVHDSLPDSHDWATRHADLHVQYRIDRENRKAYRAARRAAALGGANR